jgi:SAM-dependent methyltransferase
MNRIKVKMTTKNYKKYLKKYTEISPNENLLLPGQQQQYYKVGYDALQICKRILNGKKPKNIMDFACGYGRVLRWFKDEWPKANFICVETDEMALDYCKQYFECETINSNSKLDINIKQKVDFIFSGSLVTHLNEKQIKNFLQVCLDSLVQDGILVFSSHGRDNAYLASIEHPMYGNLVNLKKLYKKYLKKGFSYADYSVKHKGFGISLSKPSFLMSLFEDFNGFKVVYFEEAGWGQDIWGLQRVK